jgi:hypothetical protein
MVMPKKILSRTGILLPITFALLYLAGCGGGGSALPTSASSASGSTAKIVGTVDDGATSSSVGEVAMASHRAGIKVTVVETGQSTETDGSGQFVVTVPAGTVTLHFEGSGVDAQLTISGLVAGQTLTITVHASGSHADMGDGQGNNGAHDTCFTSGAKAEVEGLIDAKSADSITVMQQGKGDFRCLVSASTRIRKGNRALTLDDLTVGTRVHVSGTGRGTSAGVCEVDAAEIKLQ